MLTAVRTACTRRHHHTCVWPCNGVMGDSLMCHTTADSCAQPPQPPTKMGAACPLTSPCVTTNTFPLSMPPSIIHTNSSWYLSMADSCDSGKGAHGRLSMLGWMAGWLISDSAAMNRLNASSLDDASPHIQLSIGRPISLRSMSGRPGISSLGSHICTGAHQAQYAGNHNSVHVSSTFEGNSTFF